MMRSIVASPIKVVAALALSASGMALAADPSVARATLLGLDHFTHVDARWGEARQLTVYAHVPHACYRAPESCLILLVMHGATRDAKRTRDVWAPHADAAKLIVFAPLFEASRFKTAWYQQGGVTVATSPDDTTFAVIDRLFVDLKKRFDLPQTQFSLYGHSAGGQFVQRMHLLQPSPHVSRYVAANPGYYTLPEWRHEHSAFKYPYNVVALNNGESLVKAALKRPLTLLLGDKDNDPKHFQLNTSKGAMVQGPHRFARGEYFFAASKALAIEQKIPFAWQTVVVPGVEHDNVAMARAAVKYVAGP